MPVILIAPAAVGAKVETKNGIFYLLNYYF